ncbi:unnamed protein product, partial [Brassica rapa subsp. narinosa]
SWSVEGCGRDPYLQRVGGGLVPVWLDLWFFCRVGLSVVCGDEQLCRLLCGLEARCAAVMWWRVGCSRRSSVVHVLRFLGFGGGSLELFLPSWWSL